MKMKDGIEALKNGAMLIDTGNEPFEVVVIAAVEHRGAKHALFVDFTMARTSSGAVVPSAETDEDEHPNLRVATPEEEEKYLPHVSVILTLSTDDNEDFFSDALKL